MSETHAPADSEKYYLPHGSPWPILGSVALFCLMLGAVSWLNEWAGGWAMIPGALLLATMFFEMTARGMWSDARGTNALDGGAPYYDSYETSDAKWVAVGAVESQFWAAFVELLDIAGPDLPEQMNRDTWPELRARIAAAIARRTRDEWAELAAGTDTCITPVLTPLEVPDHPHNRARTGYVMVGDSLQPSPAPRFSRTAPTDPTPPPTVGADAHGVLEDWGFGDDQITRYEQTNAFFSP